MRKTGNTKMKFTGTLIDDLITTVERVQQKTLAEAEIIAAIEVWFMPSQDSVGCESRLLGVA
jgi:hypothetical protein